MTITTGMTTVAMVMATIAAVTVAMHMGDDNRESANAQKR